MFGSNVINNILVVVIIVSNVINNFLVVVVIANNVTSNVLVVVVIHICVPYLTVGLWEQHLKMYIKWRGILKFSQKQ